MVERLILEREIRVSRVDVPVNHSEAMSEWSRCILDTKSAGLVQLTVGVGRRVSNPDLSQIANIIGPTLHIDWVIGVWLRSHVHDWANVGVVVHLHAIFADVGPILANDLLLQPIIW